MRLALIVLSLCLSTSACTQTQELSQSQTHNQAQTQPLGQKSTDFEATPWSDYQAELYLSQARCDVAKHYNREFHDLITKQEYQEQAKVYDLPSWNRLHTDYHASVRDMRNSSLNPEIVAKRLRHSYCNDYVKLRGNPPQSAPAKETAS